MLTLNVSQNRNPTAALKFFAAPPNAKYFATPPNAPHKQTQKVSISPAIYPKIQFKNYF